MKILDKEIDIEIDFFDYEVSKKFDNAVDKAMQEINKVTDGVSLSEGVLKTYEITKEFIIEFFGKEKFEEIGLRKHLGDCVRFFKDMKEYKDNYISEQVKLLDSYTKSNKYSSERIKRVK